MYDYCALAQGRLPAKTASRLFDIDPLSLFIDMD